MGKKVMAALLLACLCLMLAACTPFTLQSTDELLRAPAVGQQQGEIQKALSSSLGPELQYKFPKEGASRYPIVLADLNGDGVEEGIALYSLPTVQEKSSTVNMAILEQQDGNWTLVQDVKGQNNDVASLEVVDLLGDGTKQIIVGFSFQNMTNKSLVVYQYVDGIMKQVYAPLAYSRYTLVDFPYEGGRGIAFASSEDAILQITYLPVIDGAFQPVPGTVSLGDNWESCAGITPSEGPDGDHLLVVDAGVSNGKLASQLLTFSADQANFYLRADSANLQKDSVRDNNLLKSRDIDNNGIVEIPLRIGEISTLNGDKRLEFIEWKDFISGEKMTKQYGILDSDRSIYVRLPDAWRGHISVKDGAKAGEWLVEDKDSPHLTLLRLKTLEPGQSAPMGAILLPGLSSAYLELRSGLTSTERASITVTSLA